MNLKVNITIEHVLVKSRVNIMVMNSKKFNVKKNNLLSIDIIGGYNDFVFVNCFGYVQYQDTLNKAIKRIIRYTNFNALDKNPSI